MSINNGYFIEGVYVASFMYTCAPVCPTESFLKHIFYVEYGGWYPVKLLPHTCTLYSSNGILSIEQIMWITLFQRNINMFAKRKEGIQRIWPLQNEVVLYKLHCTIYITIDDGMVSNIGNRIQFQTKLPGNYDAWPCDVLEKDYFPPWKILDSEGNPLPSYKHAQLVFVSFPPIPQNIINICSYFFVML